MAKVKLMVYPYVCFTISQQGKLSEPRVSHQSYMPEEMYSPEHGFIQFPIGDPLQVEIEVPDNFDPMCLEILRKHREKIKAEHVATLTKLQFMENQLLGLPAPYVLDAVSAVEQQPKNVTDVDFRTRGDIPF